MQVCLVHPYGQVGSVHPGLFWWIELIGIMGDTYTESRIDPDTACVLDGPASYSVYLSYAVTEAYRDSITGLAVRDLIERVDPSFFHRQPNGLYRMNITDRPNLVRQIQRVPNIFESARRYQEGVPHPAKPSVNQDPPSGEPPKKKGRLIDFGDEDD